MSFSYSHNNILSSNLRSLYGLLLQPFGSGDFIKPPLPFQHVRLLCVTFLKSLSQCQYPSHPHLYVITYIPYVICCIICFHIYLLWRWRESNPRPFEQLIKVLAVNLSFVLSSPVQHTSHTPQSQ
jgi:hypothetical protein